MSSINGLLLVDKPSGQTSHDVVANLRKILKQKSVGHTGTLDPLATGLMVIVLGDATKLSDYLIAEDKSYSLTVLLGRKTDTLDVTGNVLSEVPCALSARTIREAIADLEGEFEWPVPLFSAAKVDGKRLYEHGRNGTFVELPLKMMNFWGAQVQEVGADRVHLSLHCSKGSFVRSWAAELGERLGVGGCLEALRRLSVGDWHVDQAVTLEALAQDGLGEAFVPMSQALPGLKAIMAGPKECRLVGHGQIPRDLENRLIVEQKRAFESGRSVFVKVVTDQGDLLAILAAEPGQGLKIRRVFRSLS